MRIQTYHWGCCAKALTVQALATLGLSGEKGYGLRNQLVKGINWNSLHHRSVLNNFNF